MGKQRKQLEIDRDREGDRQIKTETGIQTNRGKRKKGRQRYCYVQIIRGNVWKQKQTESETDRLRQRQEKRQIEGTEREVDRDTVMFK